MDLPEEVLEIIISKLPFPDIFTARLLSRSWLAKLSAISGKEDEANRNSVTYFHRLVGESSQKWRNFYAVWFCQLRKDLYLSPSTSYCFGHDWTSRGWQKLPPLDFLPMNVDFNRFTLRMEGALLYGSVRELKSNWSIFVANVLTRTWKNLPPRPDSFDLEHPRGGYKAQLQMLVIQKSQGDLPGYMMITIGGYFLERRGYLKCDHYSAQIYYSNSNRWITKKITSAKDNDGDVDFSNIAYVNGVLYLNRPFRESGPHDLLAFSIEEGTVKIYNLSNAFHGIVWTERDWHYLVACNTTLMLVITNDMTVSVFEVDFNPRPALLKVTELTRPVLSDWQTMTIEAPISIGSCLYFLSGSRFRTILMFDVGKGKWSALTIPELFEDYRYSYSVTCFQPGMNPFMTV